ncbi:MAG TPA: shikimate kinase [Blastocatellia bacterium]|nr:shikimate kinase [Blastocatellia bacterium]
MESAIRNPQSAIFLLGFMASGKSTVGPVLAAKLDLEFIDLDLVIEAGAGCAIAELIEREGEERFREIETDTLREAVSRGAAIIAPGGGAITRAENRELMSRLGITVWLDAPFDLCWLRIQKDGATRPLAPDEATARARYEGRLALYQQSSIHIPINESHSPDDVSETIVGKLKSLSDEARVLA